jgi:DNA helicase-2/ATP-dependent DNA helicase PcrA
LLYFSYARDYGGKRLKKVSPFVLEALDEVKVDEKVVKISPLEKIKKAALEKPGQLPLLESKIIKLNQKQIDDYLTCPLKYKYATILRVPILIHHAVIYGFAMHKAVEEFYRQKQLGKILPLTELLTVFENTWVSEGFLTAEHEVKRVEQGRLSLADFWKRESERKDKPTFIEKPFKFSLGDVVMGGRWDRVDVSSNFVRITDFKSSEGIDEEKAKKRAKESIQLGVYALAYKKIYGRLPNVVGLYFLESGVVGEFEPDEKTVEKTESQIKEVEEGIKEDNFEPTPSYIACQYCAYNAICPFTATKT